ncbi:unnamed protein product [Mytilus edulis]|uniref:Novel STAND NTPase 3 domain-containing protein n=1 Tax=Mytilus edulis TaxID=6550 RepID=A0A8S3UF17_MYTED|nr:unnamed protein product [Mytilus edulis]
MLLKTPCCLCIENPEYKIAVATGKDISKHQLGIMFSTPNPHCNHSKICVDDKNPCSVTAATGIRPSSLDIRTRITLLSKFCIMMEHTDKLVQARNTVFAHAIKGELYDEDFIKLWNEIENSIIYLSQITSTDLERTRSILELREKALEESMCLEIQCLALRQTKGDETVIEEIRKNAQQTVESVEARIDVKLQEVQSQITILETNIKDIVRKALSEYSACSDTVRNIIENTKMEIEEHDADDTYVKTSAVTAATDLLRTKNLLIIIGKAGIGKSSTALAIASAFHARGNSNNKDFLGQSDGQYCSKKHADILDVLAPHVHRGISKFIFTTRSYKIEDAADEIIKCHKLFSNGAIINLNGEFSLSTTEKENILQLHAIKHKINICKKYNTKTLQSKILHYNEFENIIGTDPYLGFPEACHLFCSCDNLFAMGCKFFSSPSEKLLDEIRELRITGYDHVDVALQYCVLTSLMLDTVCKISIGIRKGIIPRESHESLNNLSNINCSMIEFIYRLLYKKEIIVTTNDIHDICNKNM